MEFIDPNCDDRVRLMRCQRDTVYLLSCDLGPRRWMDGWIFACSSAGLDLHLLLCCQVDDACAGKVHRRMVKLTHGGDIEIIVNG